MSLGVGSLLVIQNSSNHVAVGSSYIAIDSGARPTIKDESNNVTIASIGAHTDTGSSHIGTTGTQTSVFIAGISGTTIPGGMPVVVNSTGQLDMATSSQCFKNDIKPMKHASEAILSLRPVTFRYKEELDSLGIPPFALLAEGVTKVDPDLVIRDDNGKPFPVRYEAVNANS